MNRNCPPPGNLQATAYKVARQTKQKKSIEELAESVGLSESRLRALFKAEIDLTPKQYANKIKMDWAAEQVRNTYLKVTEIAARLGASSNSRFVRDFKKAHSMTPTKYRKLHQRRGERKGAAEGVASS